MSHHIARIWVQKRLLRILLFNSRLQLLCS